MNICCCCCCCCNCTQFQSDAWRLNFLVLYILQFKHRYIFFFSSYFHCIMLCASVLMVLVLHSGLVKAWLQLWSWRWAAVLRACWLYLCWRRWQEAREAVRGRARARSLERFTAPFALCSRCPLACPDKWSAWTWGKRGPAKLCILTCHMHCDAEAPQTFWQSVSDCKLNCR